VDTGYHSVQEFIEDNFIKIEFFCSAKNYSDLCIKNGIQELHERHKKKFWKKVDTIVPVDPYMIGRMLEISLAIN
jgi:hypothetical protein